MTNDDARDGIAIALLIDDPLLADRVVAILGDAPGVRLVTAGEPADVVLVSNGDAASAPPASTAAADASADPILTPREREVLALLAEGASNKTIARRLGISVHTAKFHVGSLLDKLDATGRTDAVMHAARLGVIEL
ncbi:MAG TPA: helix-turn-helix transcriptional regulator [Casimicrobiaceae bacterium]